MGELSGNFASQTGNSLFYNAEVVMMLSEISVR